MKIFDLFKKNKNNQEKKEPIINDHTLNFEIKFDNSKEKYINTSEGILKISIKNATEIFRQTIKVTNEVMFENSGLYEPHIDIDIMVVRIFKSNNGRYFYDITSSNPEFNHMNYIRCDNLSEFIWYDLNKMPVFRVDCHKLINSQIFDQEIDNSFLGEY